MCGRFTLRTPASKLVQQFFLPVTPEIKPRLNIAPTQMVAAVRRLPGQGSPELVFLKWGLIPPWADDPAIGNRMINARCETLAEKRAFSPALKERRCLLPADGFYEWLAQGKKKQPYHFTLKDGEPFAIAGLWQHWRRGEQTIDSCTVITTEANELVRPMHDRMPVILAPEEYDRCLDPNIKQPEQLLPLLDPYDPNEMVATRVS